MPVGVRLAARARLVRAEEPYLTMVGELLAPDRRRFATARGEFRIDDVDQARRYTTRVT